MYIGKATKEQIKHRPVNIMARKIDFKNLLSPEFKIVRKDITAVSTPQKFYPLK